MEQVYALFDRRCRTQTALDKLAKLRRRLLRFTQVGETLKKLFSPTLEKALTFLDDKLLPSTSNAVERGNRRYRKMQKSVYRVRTQEQISARLALDMWREAQAEGRQQTLALTASCTGWINPVLCYSLNLQHILDLTHRRRAPPQPRSARIQEQEGRWAGASRAGPRCCQGRSPARWCGGRSRIRFRLPYASSSTRPDCLWSRPACVPSAGGMVVCRCIILILPYQRQAQVDSLCEGDSGDKWRLCMYPRAHQTRVSMVRRAGRV